MLIAPARRTHQEHYEPRVTPNVGNRPPHVFEYHYNGRRNGKHREEDRNNSNHPRDIVEGRAHSASHIHSRESLHCITETSREIVFLCGETHNETGADVDDI